MDGIPTIDPSAAHESRLLALSADLLGMVGHDGVLRLANPAWGPGAEGAKLAELVDADDRAAVDAVLAELAVPGASAEFSCRINRRSIHFSARAEADCVYLAGKDVTERLRIEDELSALADTLQRTSAELQDFAYIASHDLAEPLRMITSYLELLQRRYSGQLDETADEFIGYAVGGAERMRTLIDDLLAYSRVGSHELQLAAIDLDELLALVLGGLERATLEAGGRVDAAAELGTVIGDPTQIGQLLQQLIGNAIKFSAPDRPPAVTISAEPDAGGVRLGVADNGIGIEEAHRERIFKMFTRLHGRDEYDGTGMGLSLCRRIADRHGGRIWVEAAPEQGSVFWVWLPGAA